MHSRIQSLLLKLFLKNQKIQSTKTRSKSLAS